MINKSMHKITLYKIANKFGDDRYLVSGDPVANGEALASYNNIEELYPTVISTDFTVQNYLSVASYHTLDTRAAIGMANSVHQAGAGNSQFGTQWIFSEEEKTSKKIRVTDEIPEGWQKGRKIKFEDDKNE